MVSRTRHLVLLCLFVFSACRAAAQTPAPQLPGVLGTTPGLVDFKSNQWRLERLSEHHWRLTGQVEVERDQVKFFADEIELFTDTNRLIAKGNVVFANADGRISAEEVDFDTKNLVGSFKQASGILSLGPNADVTQFGGQDPDVYFYGDLIEKVAEKTYRLTRGAFTTCVQPTPRWELTSGSVVLTLDEHAVLRHAVLRVKGVPMFYLPIAYYPLQEDQRATGFLLPTYGTSTLRGQAISNAFFWAMGRSQDATFFHDWFTRTGQGTGAEYRYVAGAGSEGSFRSYLFNQRAAQFVADSGSITQLPANRSFELTGGATQALAGGLRSRTRFDYFSDLTTQQLYHGNLYEASRRLRTLGASLNGNWGPYSFSSVYQRNEAFEGDNGSIVYGSTPRVTGALASQQMFGLPIYGGAVTEYAHLLYRDQRGPSPLDSSLMRVDLSPSVRIPFSKLTFLTVNSSAAYRLTHYTESLDARGRQVASGLTRSYVSVRSDLIGPVFTRIFNTPASRFAERFKHVVEPTFGFEQITNIDNYKRVVVLTDNADFVVGGLTRLTYGLTNRFLARTRGVDGAPGQAREFLTASIQQTYYGSPEAAQYDVTYASSNRGQQSSVSPVAVVVRAAPARTIDTMMRLEQSLTGSGMQVFSLSTSASFASQSVSGSWSRRRFDPRSPIDSYFTVNAGLRANQRRTGGNYALSWDVGRGYLVSQTANVFYNAQCCGLAFEYQAFSYPQVSSRFPLPSDRRINFSFMLAGLGTFQNFFGAFGGPR